MRMQEMGEYLSDRGFVVRWRYDSSEKVYIFDVGRDGRMLRQYFKYPGDVKPVVRDRIQREFLDDIIKQFNEPKLRNICEIDIINELNRFSANDVIRQTIENIEKGEKMRNNGIKWKVRDVTSQTDTDGLAFYAQLVGTPDGIFVGSLRDIKDNLQHKVNDEIQWDLYRDLGWPKQNPNIRPTLPAIKEVIFNDHATIVFWTDGSKTVVKCQNDDIYDPEKGLAMAIVKKALGNKGNYYNEIKKWIDEYEKRQAAFVVEKQLIFNLDNPFAEAMEKLKELSTPLKKKKEEHSKVWASYQRLLSAMDDKKATKADLKAAMFEAAEQLADIVEVVE